MLLTVANFKTLAKIDHANDDSLIQIILEGVSKQFDNYTYRTLENATAASTLDGNGKQYFFNLDYPINSITSVVLDGVTLTAGATADYIHYTSDHEAKLKKIGGVWTEDEQNLVITYDRGYSTIPDDLELACFLQASKIYDRKGISQSSRITATGDSMTFRSINMGKDVKEILDRYIHPLGKYRYRFLSTEIGSGKDEGSHGLTTTTATSSGVF